MNQIDLHVDLTVENSCYVSQTRQVDTSGCGSYDGSDLICDIINNLLPYFLPLFWSFDMGFTTITINIMIILSVKLYYVTDIISIKTEYLELEFKT